MSKPNTEPPLPSFLLLSIHPPSLLPPSSPPFIHPSSLSLSSFLLAFHLFLFFLLVPLFSSLEMFPTTFSFLIIPSILLSIHQHWLYTQLPDLLVTHSVRLSTVPRYVTQFPSHSPSIKHLTFPKCSNDSFALSMVGI